jgi:hypothetical protein
VFDVILLYIYFFKFIIKYVEPTGNLTDSMVDLHIFYTEMDKKLL